MCQQDYLQSNNQTCMKLLPEVYLRPKNKSKHFEDDLHYHSDYDKDHMEEIGSFYWLSINSIKILQ